jgi:signal transduction histidine kinase
MVGRPKWAYAADMSTEQATQRRRARPGGPWPAWPRSAPPRTALPSARDAAIAAVITVIGVVASYGEAHPTNPGAYFTPPHHLPHTPAAALLLVAAGGVVLAWRHIYPRFVVCATTALVVAYTLPGYENGVALLLPAVAVGTLSVMVPVRKSVPWAVAVTVVLMAATAANNPLGRFSGGFPLIPANIAVALFAGIAIANRQAYVRSSQLQAAREAALDAQRRVDEERLRIARELHDVVAHTMATITVQAAAASQLLRDRPDEAAASLQAIRAAGKDGLRELRAILDVLRSASDGSEETTDPTQPTPGLARLDALVEGVTAAGLPVTVTVTGRPHDLPAITDLSAFRIIQEALTNAIRHAGPATAAVTVDYGADELHVEVTDTGRGLTSAAAAYAAVISNSGLTGSAGHGLRGMRERASAAGGTIDIGPLPGGGFRVTARLPLARPSAATEHTASTAPPAANPSAPQEAAR